MKFSFIKAAAFCLCFAAGAAQSATVSFTNIARGDTAGDSLVSKFSLDVSAYLGKVLIKVISASNPGKTYFIGGIFIDDLPGSALTGEATAFLAAGSSTKVSFSADRNPRNLPQGNLVSFGTTTSYSAKNGSGNAWAVQPGETAAFLFGGTVADVMAALSRGTLRFGLHVQNLPGCKDGSDTYVTAGVPSAPPPTPVPVPASGLLLLGALGLLMRRR